MLRPGLSLELPKLQLQAFTPDPRVRRLATATVHSFQDHTAHRDTATTSQGRRASTAWRLQRQVYLIPASWFSRPLRGATAHRIAAQQRKAQPIQYDKTQYSLYIKPDGGGIDPKVGLQMRSPYPGLAIEFGLGGVCCGDWGRVGDTVVDEEEVVTLFCSWDGPGVMRCGVVSRCAVVCCNHNPHVFCHLNLQGIFTSPVPVSS
ncbi:hypothetical protein JHW43_007100 [Diplocarpon mali]|nr:hypothetical protein JHW43_007100 [Diplocarpon mali]